MSRRVTHYIRTIHEFNRRPWCEKFARHVRWYGISDHDKVTCKNCRKKLGLGEID